jgi:hypothetical protein
MRSVVGRPRYRRLLGWNLCNAAPIFLLWCRGACAATPRQPRPGETRPRSAASPREGGPRARSSWIRARAPETGALGHGNTSLTRHSPSKLSRGTGISWTWCGSCCSCSSTGSSPDPCASNGTCRESRGLAPLNSNAVWISNRGCWCVKATLPYASRDRRDPRTCV